MYIYICIYIPYSIYHILLHPSLSYRFPSSHSFMPFLLFPHTTQRPFTSIRFNEPSHDVHSVSEGPEHVKHAESQTKISLLINIIH